MSIVNVKSQFSFLVIFLPVYQVPFYKKKIMHYFKVVFIKELGEVEPIPHQWEDGGILYWPLTKSEVRKNQSNANSLPDKRTWKKYDCIVKAQNISAFKYASEIADKICEESSDAEEIFSATRRISKPPAKYYDSYLNNPILLADESRSTSPHINSESSEQSCFEKSTSENTEENTIKNNLENNTNLDLSSISFLASQTDMMQVISLINDLKEDVNKKMVEMSIKIDKIESLIKDMKDREFTLPTVTPKVEIFPLGTLAEIYSFEKKLTADEFKQKILHHLRRIIGTGSASRIACYKLSAILFTKELLTLFSWTGVSKTAKKEAFNKLVNVLEVFYGVIAYADNTFCQNQMEIFFKDGILKHSQSRLNPKKKISKDSTDKPIANTQDGNNEHHIEAITVVNEGEEGISEDEK